MHKKDNKTLSTLKPRKQMGLKQIKLNNFLFKKTKYLSPNPNPQPQSFEPNHNLRIHIKSEMSQQLQPQVEEVMNSASTSINMKTALSNKTSFYKKKNMDINIPNDLTFRILKLSKNKVRSRYQPSLHHHGNRSGFFQQGARRKSFLVSYHNKEYHRGRVQKQVYSYSNKYTNVHSKSVSYSSFRNETIIHKKDEDTQRIFDNYKLTQRIVFFEQLQQKKDMQRHLLMAPKKFQSSIRTQGKNEQKDSTQLKICRPWSGHSQKSNHSP